MNNFTAIDNGSFVNVYVGNNKDACFTIDKNNKEWGCAPEDNRATWESLCERAGLNPNDADDALNKALTDSNIEI